MNKEFNLNIETKRDLKASGRLFVPQYETLAAASQSVTRNIIYVASEDAFYVCKGGNVLEKLGSSLSLVKGFMEDTLTIAGAKTIIPRFTYHDDFLGSNNNNVGGVFFGEFINGTGAEAQVNLIPANIVGATGLGYANVRTGTTSTGYAVLQASSNSNNGWGSFRPDYYFRVRFRNIIIETLSDATDTYLFHAGIKRGLSDIGKIAFEYTHGINGGAFTCTSNNTTANIETSNSGVIVAPGVEYSLEIEYFNGVVKYWINGALVSTHITYTPSTSALIGTSSFGVTKTAGTSTRAVHVDAITFRLDHKDNI